MLRLIVGTVLLFLMGLTEALAVEETKKDNIGPWEIEATFKDNKFDHCAISRKVDEVVASFLRTSDGLSLTLESPNWKLERGKNYPVLMNAGAKSWNTDVAADGNSASVPISDNKFREGLRAANVLIVEGAGSNDPNSSGPESRGARPTGQLSDEKQPRSGNQPICGPTSATVTSTVVRYPPSRTGVGYHLRP